MLARFHRNGNTTSLMPDAEVAANHPIASPHIAPAVQTSSTGTVIIDSGKRVPVPDFSGAALRTVIEHAGALGLRVQTLGSGLAHEQAPAAGTMVPSGTEIVVRFNR